MKLPSPSSVAFVVSTLLAASLPAQAPGSAALPWSVLFGGSGEEYPEPYDALAIASNGDVLVCGLTVSGNFPRTAGPAYQGNEDAFVARLRDGRVIWRILLGGSGRDGARAIVEDGNGDVWVAGRTSSADFLAAWPYQMTASVPQPTYGGGSSAHGDGFLLRLGNTLTASPTIAYATYLGGAGDDVVSTMTLCLNGTLLAAGGWTASPDFPLAGAPFQTTHAGALPPPAGQLGADGFLAMFDVATGALTNTTYVGGASDDLVVDLVEVITLPIPGCNLLCPPIHLLVATGRTMSTSFPVTPAIALDTTLGGIQDAFLVTFDLALGQLWYGSYLGGSGDDVPFGLSRSHRLVPGANAPNAPDGVAIAIGTDVWVVGQTTSPDFPTTPGCLQPSFQGGAYYGVDGFVIHLELFGSPQRLYSTYLGGPGDDSIMDLAVDRSGFVTAVGLAGSPPFPHTTAGSLRPTFLGGGGPPVGPTDGFVVRLDPSQAGLAQLVYGTFLGGSQGQENVMDVALRANGNAVVTGWTWSADFPATGTSMGTADVFVAELSLLPNDVVRYGAPSPSVCAPTLHLAVDGAPTPGNAGFEVLVHGAVANAPGVLFLGAPSPAATPLPGLGLDAWLQLGPGVVDSAAVLADGDGFARFAVPIPPGYLWGSVAVQAVWGDLGPAPCALLLASDALR